MFLPDDPESNTRNVDSDKEEKVLVTPEDLMTEQPGGSSRASLRSASIVSTCTIPLDEDEERDPGVVRRNQTHPGKAAPEDLISRVPRAADDARSKGRRDGSWLGDAATPSFEEARARRRR